VHASDWPTWLTILLGVGPLWVLLTTLLVLARRLGTREARLPVVAAICLIAMPLGAFGYAIFSGWRPGWGHVIVLIATSVGSHVMVDRFSSTAPKPQSADLAQWGRDVHARLRSELTKLGLVIAIAGVVIATAYPAIALLLVGATALWTLLWLPPGMRRAESGLDVIVGRKPEEIFDFLADERNQPRYLPEVESVERLTLGSPHLGSRFKVQLVTGAEATEEILEYDRPRRLAVGLPDTIQPNRSIWTFQPVPEGTRVRYAYRHDLTMVEALAGARLTAGEQAARLNAWRRGFLERLKAALEAPAESVEDQWSA